MALQRRDFLKTAGSACALGLAPRLVQGMTQAQEQVERATRAMPLPRIKDISVIECEPAGSRLTVVKITTDQDGLYGYGCATFTQRADLVKPAVEKYLKPFLLGKTTDRIEDIWQSCYDSSYWRNGPVLNNALSGIDQALWDIKGRQAGMPVYQLAGGKCREAVDAYAHADGAEYAEVIDNAKKFMAQGFRNVRVQVGVPGMAGYGAQHGEDHTLKPLHNKPLFEPAYAMRRGLKLLETARKELGEEVNLLHDMHERLTPNEAVMFCKEAEQYNMFFLEDPLSPEDLGYFQQIRQNCATPIAMGELFNSPHEWQPLIEGRLIDYIRVHLSEAGGFTPSRKIAILAEMYGVKTAWHGPGDVSPVGHMANVTLDIVSYNFGIQEYTPFNETTQEIFRGCPVLKNGYLWVNEKPGWGIEIDEQAAAKYPFRQSANGLNGGWGEIRKLDGTVIKQ
ncbi:enolase C-terminal domain-like protein [Paracidobacterium acidisoli]|uniref:Starvation-sensing protein RspA n=1 Tax=Paracidobacterium acidisoli TaxID=2303751 RepID=A0A372IU84_9BACT|nr:enolase C-terminal domain-like protein [Paracidobacterium acidisoli]